MKIDEGRIFRAHRERLAREAKALVAEQASQVSAEQSFTPSGPPQPAPPTMNENGELIWKEPQNKPETR